MKIRQTICMKRHAFIKQSNLQEQKIEEIKKHQLDSSKSHSIEKLEIEN